MKRKLLNKKKYPPSCSYCRHGKLAPDGEAVLCIKKGIVPADEKCHSYSYDPLKRVPKKPPELEHANPSDFEL